MPGRLTCSFIASQVRTAGKNRCRQGSVSLAALPAYYCLFISVC